MIHHRSHAAKIIVRRRRRRSPFQRRRFPRIIARLRPLEHAPEKIDHKNKLRRNRDDGCVGHELVNRHQLLQVRHFRILRISPRSTRHAQVVHRHEDRVRSRERQEEVHSSPGLIHHPSKHFRKPVISRRKHSKDCRHAHDQVKVSDHKIGIVQLNVEHRLRQKRTTQSTRDEKRNEANGVEHRRMEPNVPLPHRAQPVKCFDRRWHANTHRQDGKRKCRIRTHAAHEHVVAPHHEPQETDGEHGINHGLVAKDRLARERRENL